MADQARLKEGKRREEKEKRIGNEEELKERDIEIKRLKN